jgi:hypothetical protein
VKPPLGSTKELRTPFAPPRFAGNGRACYGPRSPPWRYSSASAGLGLYSGDVLRDPAFELNCFLTGSVYLVIAAVMLGYLSTYEREVRIALGARRSERRPWKSLAIGADRLSGWRLPASLSRQ